MKSISIAISLIILMSLVLAIPALAGGWAAITLEELPASVTMGEPVHVRFTVRQHGRTLMVGLTPTLHARNAESGEAVSQAATAVPDQPGVYETSLTFPSAGTWEWSIQAFTMDQPMPDLTVRLSSPLSNEIPVQPSPIPIAAGVTGLVVAVAAATIVIRRQMRWALALVILGLLVGGAGFASAASRQSKELRQPKGLAAVPDQPESLVETGQAIFVAKGCVTCHTNNKVDQKYYEFDGNIGPNLTSYSASPEFLRLWLKDPASVRPNAGMPNLELDDTEIEALIAFLNNKSSSISPKTRPTQVPEKVVTATPVENKPAVKEAGCSEKDSSHGILVSYSRDDSGYLALLDPSSGMPLCNISRLNLGKDLQFAYSPDRLGLAVLNPETEDQQSWRLRWIDLHSWKAIDTGVVLPGWFQGMAVRPDRTRVVIAHAVLTKEAEPRMLGYRLVQADLSAKSALLESDLDISPRLVAYSKDGQFILLYGVQYDYAQGTSTSPAKIELYNSSDLSLAWKMDLGDVQEGVFKIGEGNDPDQFTNWQPALALSPDHQKLYIVHADADRLTTVDFGIRKINTAEIRPGQSWIERFISMTASVAYAKGLNGTIKQAVLSQDGVYLYVTGFTGHPYKDQSGNWQFDVLPFGLQKINVASGMEVAHIESDANEISLSASGKAIFLKGWTNNLIWTDVLSTESLEKISHVEGQHLFPTWTISGGSVLLASSEVNWTQRFNILDTEKMSQIAVLEGQGYWMSVP